MQRTFSPRLFAFALLAGLLVLGLRAAPADGYCAGGGGGRVDPIPEPEPEGDGPPVDDGTGMGNGGDTTGGGGEGGGTPTTPAPGLPPSGQPGTPTTPGMGGATRGRRAGSTSSIDAKWSTWWVFNRWSFLPRRNEVVRRHFARFRVVTGEGVDMRSQWAGRRDKLASLRAGPALIELMGSDLAPGDLGIKASASVGLARVSNDAAAVNAVLQAAEDTEMVPEVRQAAAFAAGLFRRADAERQMSGAALDKLRARLLALSEAETTPSRVACLAILSVGMLGDQPTGTPLPTGVMEARTLWKRLTATELGGERHVAYLTALGLLPVHAASTELLDGLLDIAIGKRFAKRSWSSRERSHALSSLVRLGGARSRAALTRLLTDRRLPAAVRRAAFIQLGERADAWPAAERKTLVRTWDTALQYARDPLTRGLGLIALGRIVAADLADENGGDLLRTTDADATLLKHAGGSAQNVRGFALLALALAVREADDSDRAAATLRARGEAILRQGLRERRGNAEALGPYIVAAGLARLEAALPTLEAIVIDANSDQRLRAYAAVACGQIGRATPTTVNVLKKAVADHRMGNLRVEAAIGLAYLTGNRDAKLLREDIERRRYTHSHRIGHVAIALGQMGDLKSIVPLASLVLDAKSDHGARGAAAVALGLLCDPEVTPSLSRLWKGVNYPARSAALHTALNYY